MYMLAFMYPHQPGQPFNYQHFLDVHLPLGLGLTEKYLGLKPLRLVVHTPTRGGDGSPDSARYGAVSQIFFATETEVSRFATLFSFEEAARRLSEDFKNYTPHPPEILIAQVHELGPDALDGFVTKFKTQMA